MSLIDMSERFTLADVMRGIELHAKSGLLVVKQGVQWVELYFHQGNLMCIGPVRTHATLGERLLIAGIISSQALQETLSVIGDETQSEARIARTLIDRKHVSREVLRIWAVERATEVIQPLLSWSPCELSFDENVALPSDRLFVKITPSSLLAESERVVQHTTQSALPASSNTPTASPEVLATMHTSLPPISMNSNPGSVSSVQDVRPMQSFPSIQAVQPAASAQNVYRVDIAKVPTLMETSQFFPENVPVTPLLRSTDPLLAAVKTSGSAKVPAFTAPSPASIEKQTAFPTPPAMQEMQASTVSNALDMPSMNFPTLLDEQDIPSSTFALLFDEQEEQAVAQPKPLLSAESMRVDTSFMREYMVLMPQDMEQLARQELDIQITPPQWQLLIRADGQTPLSKICADLRLYPEQVCQIAGELMILGLVQVIPTQMVPLTTAPLPELSSAGRDAIPAGTYNAPMPLNTMLPATPPLGTPNADVQSSFVSIPSFDAQSQGSNRGNSTTFGPGTAWGASPMQLQAPPSSGPVVAAHGNYVPVGGRG